jgi:hypothetical protein
MKRENDSKLISFFMIKGRDNEATLANTKHPSKLWLMKGNL